jgi:hypothetical protein
VNQECPFCHRFFSNYGVGRHQASCLGGNGSKVQKHPVFRDPQVGPSWLPTYLLVIALVTWLFAIVAAERGAFWAAFGAMVVSVACFVWRWLEVR